MGARPLRRTIQREIEDPLSERILFNELGPGQTAVVGCDGDGLVFSTVTQEEVHSGLAVASA
jgi:ATP-dependent Clp protease ATP-binding subunit ClpC